MSPRWRSIPSARMVAAGRHGRAVLHDASTKSCEVVRVTVQATAGKMPVVAGTGYNAAIGADIARRVEKAGAGLRARAAALLHQRSRRRGCSTTTSRSATPPGFRCWSTAATGPCSRRRWWRAWPTACRRWRDGRTVRAIARKYQRIMNEVGDRLAWFGGLGDDCVPGILRHRRASLHLEHLEYRAEGFAGFGRGRHGARLPSPRCAHGQVRPSALSRCASG